MTHLVVTAVLRIDGGRHTRPWNPPAGFWIELPTADYECRRCGHTACASGDQVPAFVRDIRTTHQNQCPRKDTE